MNYEKKLDSRCLAWHKKYRTKFEIMASILEAIKENGATRFSIMKHASTNFVKIKKYLESLDAMGFVETDVREDQVLYRASEKGLGFLRQYYALLEILLNTSTHENTALPKSVKITNPSTRYRM